MGSGWPFRSFTRHGRYAHKYKYWCFQGHCDLSFLMNVLRRHHRLYAAPQREGQRSGSLQVPRLWDPIVFLDGPANASRIYLILHVGFLIYTLHQGRVIECCSEGHAG